MPVGEGVCDFVSRVQFAVILSHEESITSRNGQPTSFFDATYTRWGRSSRCSFYLGTYRP